MNRLWYIPLEDAPQRYTVMMNQSVKPLVDGTVEVPAVDASAKFSGRFFLDPSNTIIFKSRQVEQIIRMMQSRTIKHADGLLFGDIFFPGLEGIAYTAELLGIKLHIFGWNYAGRADRTDLVRQLDSWADDAEASWHRIASAVFVGSEFHKRNVVSYFKCPNDKVHVTGYPLDLTWIQDYMRGHEVHLNTVKDRVIWPHRICWEKGFGELCSIARTVDLPFLITSSGDEVDLPYQAPKNVEVRFNLPKHEYYQLLASSRYYLSTAYQETFGYTLQEAIHFGCNILVPNRACYPEMVPHQNLYGRWEDAADRLNLRWASKVPTLFVQRWDRNAESAIDICRSIMRGESVGCE
jgi:hypothetical protein